MKQGRKVTIISIMALLFAFVSLGVSYSTFNINKSENGVATILEKKADIKLSGVKNLNNSEGSTFNTEPSISNYKVNFGASLNDVGATVTYNFVVSNKGNSAAMVKEINVNGLDQYAGNVIFSIDGISVGDMIRYDNDDIVVSVSLTYSDAVIETVTSYDDYGYEVEDEVVLPIDIESIDIEFVFE